MNKSIGITAVNIALALLVGYMFKLPTLPVTIIILIAYFTGFARGYSLNKKD